MTQFMDTTYKRTFDPKDAKQYLVCLPYGNEAIVFGVDNQDRYFRKESYGWARQYGAPSPIPEGTLVVLCESEEDANGI